MLKRILNLFFPPKCVLCRKVLSDQQTDLCHECRVETPDFPKANLKISFVAGWTALWYYKDKVRYSMLRFKFYNARSYADSYGRLLAMKLYRKPLGEFDVLTWVPVGSLRRWKRGYDQVELIAHRVADELGIRPIATLKKQRNTPKQSQLTTLAHRKANVLGAFRITDPELVKGKRILLLDDIITTGATASECARVLLTAGAKEVYVAAVAAAVHDKKDR